MNGGCRCFSAVRRLQSGIILSIEIRCRVAYANGQNLRRDRACRDSDNSSNTLTPDKKEPESTMTIKSNKAAETEIPVETKPMTEVDRSFEEITKPTTEPPAPAVKDEAALTDPAASPEYEPQQTTVTVAPEPKADTPQHGDTKDGKIYINGFGWVKDEGGDTHGETAADMYQNGNKIGSFG